MTAKHGIGYKILGFMLSDYRPAGPQGSRSLRLPEFLDNHHMKVVRLSALCTGCLYPIEEIPGSHFCGQKDSVNEKSQ
jgi:hypothetical protein